MKSFFVQKVNRKSQKYGTWCRQLKKMRRSFKKYNLMRRDRSRGSKKSVVSQEVGIKTKNWHIHRTEVVSFSITGLDENI